MDLRPTVCGKKKAHCLGRVIAVVFLFVSSVFAVEPIGFYDWQADVLKGDKGWKRCTIQFSGATRNGIFLSMDLSLIEKVSPEEKERVTLLKITAGRMNPAEPSEPSPIKIEDAWIETSRGSSLGKFKTSDIDQGNDFLAGAAGFEIFEGLLNDIEKNGITLGFRPGADSAEKVIQIPAPPPSLFIKLYSC